MADIYMHAKLARELIKEHPTPLIKELVITGAQGPDPMYYGFVHQYHTQYRTIADRMHDTDTTLLFTAMFDYAKRHPSLEIYSYMIGFLCHFALDVKIHPYVYHHVGVYDKFDETTHYMRGLHLKFERSIDAALIEHDTKKKAHHYHIKQTFPIKKIPTEIASMYTSIIKERYQYSNGDIMIKRSVQSMYRVVRYIVKDKTGIKKLFYMLLNKTAKDEDLFFSDLSFYHHLEAFDYLNIKQRTWHHPITNKESQKTVFDLYQDAHLFAQELIAYFDLYLQGKETKSINQVIQNLSFNSGMPCDDKRVMKHYNIYRK